VSGAVLPREFYAQPTLLVTERLLGKVLVSRSGEGVTSGVIVETEAYLQGDPANHAHRRRTPRNSMMFSKPGRAYVYLVHMHHCLNAVTEPEGVACAVLIRALEPLEGLELMRERRKVQENRLLTSGPGRLTKALGVTLVCNGTDLTSPLSSTLTIEDRGIDPGLAARSSRIGISTAKELPYRFYVPGNPFVSHTAKRPLNSAG
jgi:DNA-3-methyladenine glycosylase